MMTEFESALKELNDAGRRSAGNGWINKLERRRTKLEGGYAILDKQDRDPIAYSSLSARTAYVFAYAPVRAEYTRQYMERHRIAVGAPLFKKKSLRVVSFGGGPASELVGLVRFLEAEKEETVRAIDYTVYDKDGDWAAVAAHVVAALRTDIIINISFVETDVASKKLMTKIDLSEVDLVFFSYIMSELACLESKDQIAENFRSILSGLQIGSKIIFMDNRHPVFIKYFQACKLVTGLMQRNDDDKPVVYPAENMPATFKELSDALGWTPRTGLNSVSKLIVRSAE